MSGQFNESSKVNEYTEDSLQQVHIVFRHGDRTPDVTVGFNNNPHANEKYFPYGFDELTLNGKIKAYKLGKLLHSKYVKFLGSYQKDLLKAYASDYRRTQMTLLSVLAAMFPPNIKTKIDNNLNWQPIPYSIPAPDKLIAVHKAYPESLLVTTKIEEKEVEELYKYLTEHTGQIVANSYDILAIYDTMLVQKELGFEIPKWAKPIWNETFRKAAMQYGIDANNQYLPKLVGNLLNKILEDSKGHIAATTPQKLFLYSGHDITITSMLGAFDAYKGETINYASYVALELHQIDEVYGFKVFRYNWDSKNPIQVEIPGFGLFCPIHEFKDKIVDKLYRNV